MSAQESTSEPLPRRTSRAHLEPQLQVPWSAGSGTPFAAFDGPDEPTGEIDSARVAAEFHEGTERGRAATDDRPAGR